MRRVDRLSSLLIEHCAHGEREQSGAHVIRYAVPGRSEQSKDEESNLGSPKCCTSVRIHCVKPYRKHLRCTNQIRATPNMTNERQRETEVCALMRFVIPTESTFLFCDERRRPTSAFHTHPASSSLRARIRQPAEQKHRHVVSSPI